MITYSSVIPAIFLSRPNRFIATVQIGERIEVAHVKNTGRSRELLIPGCQVYLSVAEGGARKTKYDVIAVQKERAGKPPLMINMDSQLPNALAAEWLPRSGLFSECVEIRREVVFGSSRFDLFASDGDRKAYLEVKGVTLENNGVAMFPDAPTERGVKHLRELISCIEHGFEAYILFVIQMKDVRSFCPNDQTHKAFGDALRLAKEKGVRIVAVDSRVMADAVEIDQQIPVIL